jgi:hypothetical protein
MTILNKFNSLVEKHRRTEACWRADEEKLRMMNEELRSTTDSLDSLEKSNSKLQHEVKRLAELTKNDMVEIKTALQKLLNKLQGEAKAHEINNQVRISFQYLQADMSQYMLLDAFASIACSFLREGNWITSHRVSDLEARKSEATTRCAD